LIWKLLNPNSQHQTEIYAVNSSFLILRNFILFCLFILSTQLFSQKVVVPIAENWQFSETGKDQWHPTQIPNSIHTDLFENGLIPHPFVGDNEKDLQWIADRYWTYKTEFKIDKQQLKSKNSELVFEGLDTYAKVFLNGKLILEADNAFRIWKVDVKKYLKENNELKIEFTPTSVIEAKKMRQLPYELPEGPRMFTRKAAFQYGWDWGSKYNTVGIWRKIYLNFWEKTKIEDVYIRQNLLTEEKAELTAEIELKNSKKDRLKAEIYVNNQLKAEKEFRLHSKSSNLKIPIEINQPKFWWTNGLGYAYLHEFKIQVKDLQGNLIDEKIIKKGLRTIELITNKDRHGESFYFKLNGVPVFMKGANYIPQNSFQNWVTKENYEKLLDDVQWSNMNMLRVWGGGIYEDDYFYELCDEKGILVWQDFMFANGMYPGDEEFLENVRQEAIDNVRRLRNHASIALWCGNNEISEGWHRWGWQEGRSEAEKAEIWGNYQKLFNGILPEIVNEYSDLSYWESSPKYGRGDSRYISEGDAHDWWIWHDGHPFEDLLKNRPRFMSEFGFQSFPSEEVIHYINKDHSNSLDSEDMKNHQKHQRGFEIIRTYMERDFPVPDNEEDYAYMSQLVQAYGIGKGVEAQRRNMPYTMGSLYWQLNDCWPVVSWSGIEFFGYWKPLQYQIEKSFSNILVSFEREEDGVKVFIVNDRLEELTDELMLSVEDFDGNILKEIKLKPNVPANSSIMVISLDLNEFKGNEDKILIRSDFNSYESNFYLVKPKDLKLKPSQLQISVREFEKYAAITLKSNTLEKDILLIYDGKPIEYFSEIHAGKSRTIDVKTSKFDKNKLKIKVLNNFVSQK